MSNDVWHLGTLDWLQTLSSEEIEKLRSASVIREHSTGDTIFAPESTPNELYLLEGGMVRIYRLSEEGAETTFGYVAPGEVFGELSALGNFNRESFAVATRPSRVWKVPGNVFRELLSNRVDLVFEITRQIGARFKKIESRVENLVFREARARVAHILLELANDFGSGEPPVTIDIDITQAELATLVGITRQTANSHLREFEELGAIGRKNRHITLLKPEALAKIAIGVERETNDTKPD